MNQNMLSTSEDRQLAHDLRNALSPILLYSEFLVQSLSKLSLDNEEQMARMITDSVKEMDAMIVQKLGGVKES